MDQETRKKLEDAKVSLFNAHAKHDVSPLHKVHQASVRRCEAFSEARMGICDQPLDEHGNCPRASDHGDHLRCSSCGSNAPHHVAHVASHGQCVT